MTETCPPDKLMGGKLLIRDFQIVNIPSTGIKSYSGRFYGCDVMARRRHSVNIVQYSTFVEKSVKLFFLKEVPNNLKKIHFSKRIYQPECYSIGIHK